ncbi:inositol monophosphatase family protein [Phycicoccus duodecadis]|uniref:Inositol-1-monophosphatase n=1 Tax=Phycicoccus duodecadis TaxID=173053 RepID=A0A2N3YFB7_9MICO|nr:inositol monophosphatase family protein [Phycicoccus duodecadis]PKW25554.1 myo-inositol-1(or 4)-monophosphatase [Phycicoccus duodecadis]
MAARVAPAVPDGLDVAALEAVAVDVARAAGRLVVDERPDDLGMSEKSSRTDVVTEMDQRSQELVLDLLAQRRPDDAAMGEEEGGRTGTSGVTWVVDPIDGTTNYLYSVPAYAVSVAAVVGDPAVPGAWRAVAGAVFNPATDELFHAHRGGGARLTARTGTTVLRVSTETDLALSLVGTGFGYAAATRARQARILVDLLPQVRDIRRAGSAALDLCAVACGRLDGYYESGLNVWDRAAGELVALEAGAVLGGLDGDVADRDLTWTAGPGLAPVFAGLVRDLTRTHLGGPAQG